MSRITMHGDGVTARLPGGWEGAIVRQPPLDLAASRRFSALDADERARLPDEIPSLPVVHLASFPLPEDRGDFGSGAVELMGPDDVLVALVEYGPEHAGSPLFAEQGLPRRLVADDFSPTALQRTIAGHAGHQRFVTVGERAFCLYVVIGAADRAERLAATASEVLSGLDVATSP